MSDSARVKMFMKKQIESKRLTVEDLTKLNPDHLLQVKDLQGIKKSVIADTLMHIQARFNQHHIEEDLMRLVEKKVSVSLKDVKQVFRTKDPHSK
jgi:hypothetical protein